MTTRRKLVVGNWKMHGSHAANAELLQGILAARPFAAADVAVCAPFPYLSEVAVTLANSGVAAGTYKSVTVDAKGRVTGGTNPTTLSGYGITDAAPLASPALTGTPTAPTAAANTNTTQLATTAFVIAQIAAAGSAGTAIDGGSF